MTSLSYSDGQITRILADARVFAFIGASANTSRPSYFAMKYLLSKGYVIHPVNPGQAGGEILGKRVHASLAEVPEPVDVVDIFRSSEAAMGVVQDVIAVKDRLGVKVIWMQLGVRNDAAARLAEAAGIEVVMNRCPKIEYGRLSGEIGWSGVNTNKISSVRPRLAVSGVQNHLLTERR